MEELIFFAVIIFFSILESVARSRRAKAKKESGEAEPEQFEWAQTPPWERDLPTYDEDPSYDDRLEQVEPHRGGPRSSTTAADRGEEIQAEGGPKSGATELAAELLAELAGLSRPQERERRESRPVPAPRQPPSLPESTGQVGRTEIGRRGAEIGAHEIHRSHAGYGTDPSERAPSREDFVPAGPSEAWKDAMAVRDQLRSGSASALRRSIILKEVLGPPLGLER